MMEASEARDIAAQTLPVHLDLTPAGERYARLIRAEGGVRTKQGGDEMQAGELTAELAPAPPAPATPPAATVDASDAKHVNPFGGGAGAGAGGNAQLVSLVAQGGVKLTTAAKGANATASTAAAEMLKVENTSGRRQYHLIGKPTATVTQGATIISGPAIRFAPDEQIAEVLGAGGMKGTLPDDPKESFDIAWAGGAVVSGVTNLIDVTKQVVIKSVQEDGTINTATSSRLQAKLEPSTKPAAATAPSATKSSQADEMN